MSIWCQIEGTVTIPKKEKVSVRDLIEEYFSDEYTIKQDSESFNETYIHKISTSICIDGDWFLKQWPSFEKDLTATLRFL